MSSATGEITRAFWKDMVTREVYCVELDPTGHPLAALKIEPAVSCRHAIDTYDLNLDEGQRLAESRRGFELVELECHDATHLLRDIGDAERECQGAEEIWKAADTVAKAHKKTFEAAQDKLRSVVREATNPKPLPLFAAPAV